ncbi:PiggyBac transposable element-derived protein 4 [Phytophthora citrophthora]|uniref:PiggyBac transposable element-derived protein 4 n=1 Tax=Phytophthora citrophthora TaxID=4793 RepID=A0AAD9LQ67_9STRA|nr:PiggyBac transposable element-derived protein 4 [Phytophthora citrophthora]
MVFQARWRELKKAGWTSKLPTGLSVNFTYLKPGKAIKDVKGEDAFVGEEALMKYLDKIDLNALRAKKQARRDGSANAARRRNAAKAASIAIPDTAESSRVHTPAGRLLDHSPDNSLTRQTQASPPVSILGPESTPRPSVPQTPEALQPVSPHDTTYSPGSNGDHFDSSIEDVNHVAANDDPREFALLESDAENDDGDDKDQPGDTTDDGEVQLPVSPEMRFDDRLLSSLGGMESVASGIVPGNFLKEMGVNGWSELASHTPYDYLQEPYQPRSAGSMQEDYPHLYSGHSGPTSRALAAASTPSRALFYFFQPQLWEDIAAESTDYFLASIDERVEGQHAKQVARERKHREYKAKSREAIRKDVLKAPPIEARELCVFIGLLVARSIVPNKEKLANHWKTREEGAIPHGCFDRFTTHDGFMHISRNLHFSPNDDPAAKEDRAWKLRSVIDALHERFAAGFTPPAIIAFDEAMLSSHSTFNRLRVYIKDKSHKWGTKLIMLCCSTTACCIRILRKKERAGQTSSTDLNSGPAAVARNLQQVFGPTAPPTGQMRLVVMDRFYSSVPLSMQLLIMLIPKKKKGDKKKPPKIPKNRPKNIDRGTFIVAESLHVPAMRVLRWWDTRAVHLLCTGGSVQPGLVVRRDVMSGEQHEVACPRVVKDYQTYMGGVDVHDQLRLQRYLLQLCIMYKKYYKGLFLGLVDLAIINAYIVFNAARAASGHPKMSHELRLELCQLRDKDWEILSTNASFQPTPSKEPNARSAHRAGHKPLLNNEWRPGNNNQGRKRRTRVCKVCSLLKDTSSARGGDSSTYCSTCTLQTMSKKSMARRVFLCEKKRHTMKGELRSCFDIWHKCWSNGALAPAPQQGGRDRSVLGLRRGTKV